MLQIGISNSSHRCEKSAKYQSCENDEETRKRFDSSFVREYVSIERPHSSPEDEQSRNQNRGNHEQKSCEDNATNQQLDAFHFDLRKLFDRKYYRLIQTLNLVIFEKETKNNFRKTTRFGRNPLKNHKIEWKSRLQKEIFTDPAIASRLLQEQERP